MREVLKKVQTPYVDAQTLLTLWARYKKPREKISRLVKKGELIRLKNGFYLIADRIHPNGNTIIPFEQVANLLYGPSYVSLEWALSFYGLIPERVHTVTSMALGRDKEYHTSVGHFVYHRLSPDRYAVGITQKEAVGFIGGFLIATPEKALADLVYTSCRGLNKTQLKKELIESRRIDQGAFQHLDKELLAEIGQAYRSTGVQYLVDLIGIL